MLDFWNLWQAWTQTFRRLFRTGPHVIALWHSYRIDGRRIPREPIPWNADVVYVNALVEWYGEPSFLESGFELRLAGQMYLRPFALRRQEERVFGLHFCFPPAPTMRLGVLCWQTKTVSSFELPYLCREDRPTRVDSALESIQDIDTPEFSDGLESAHEEWGPTATFTSEGGFRWVGRGAWSQADDIKLEQRLNRLIEL
jgi:hypothetical protein